MRKYISELSIDELRNVFNANKQLQADIVEDMSESEMDFIGDQLDQMRGLSSWSIGQSNRDQHIHVNKPLEFIRSIRELQDAYVLLNTEDEKTLIKAESIVDRLNDAIMGDDPYYNLEDKLDAVADEIAGYLVDKYTRILDVECLDNDNLLNYFIEFYALERLDDGCYIDENYILYEDVSYTKSYA